MISTVLMCTFLPGECIWVMFEHVATLLLCFYLQLTPIVFALFEKKKPPWESRALIPLWELPISPEVWVYRGILWICDIGFTEASLSHYHPCFIFTFDTNLDSGMTELVHLSFHLHVNDLTLIQISALLTSFTRWWYHEILHYKLIHT